MGEKVIDFANINKLFDVYYNNRIWFLSIICFVEAAFIIRLIKQLDEEILIGVLKKCFNAYFYSISLGMILQFFGVNVLIALNSMPLLIFLLALVLILISYIYNFFRFFRSRLQSLIQAVKCICILIWAEVFLLTLMKQLEIIELTTAIFSSFFLELIVNWAESYIEKKYKFSTELQNKGKDLPIDEEDDLFYRRQIQLRAFLQIINKIGEEPFAVMISGEWGSGKSSFINVFEKKIDNAEFIKIEGGFKSNIRELLDDIANQLLEIFKKNGIMDRGNNFINSYFRKAADMVEGSGNKFAAYILRELINFNSKGYAIQKDEINKKLEMFYRMTRKKIFIVIDNLDRLTAVEREHAFEIIRESVYLRNCITIFLVDYQAFITDYLNEEFIEKYVNYHIRLHPLNFEDIYYKLKTLFLNKKFQENKSEIVCRKSSELKNQAVDKVSNIIKKLRDLRDKCLEDSRRDDASDYIKERCNTEINQLDNIIGRLKERTGNPRKVIRFFRDIENSLEVVESNWFSKQGYERNEFTKGDWSGDIFEVSFIKCFLPEEYGILIRSGNFYNLEKEKEYFIISSLLSNLDKGTMEINLLQLIVYQLYAMDLIFDKTEHQKLIEELDSRQLNEDNILRYVQELLGVGMEIEYYNIVLEYLGKHSFDDTRNKVQAVKEILSKIISEPTLYNPNFKDIHCKLKEIIIDLRNKNELTNIDISFIKRMLENLEIQAIFGRYSNFKSFINLIFGDVSKCFPEDIYGIDTFYNLVINLMKKTSIKVFKSSDDKIETIVNYLNCIKNYLQNEQFQSIQDVGTEIIDALLYVFELLGIWHYQDNVQYSKVYFSLEDIKVLPSTWESFDSWHHALLSLYNLSIEKNQNSLGLLVIQFMFETENKVINQDDSIFINKESETAEELQKLFTYMNNKYPLLSKQEWLRWKWCLVGIYRIKELADKEHEGVK